MYYAKCIYLYTYVFIHIVLRHANVQHGSVKGHSQKEFGTEKHKMTVER